MGQNQTILLADDTGQIRVTLWNDQVDDAARKKLAPGASLEIDFANVGEYQGKPQLQLAKNTNWKVILAGPLNNHPNRQNQNADSRAPSSPANGPAVFLGLNQLSAETIANIRVLVLSVFPIKDFETRDGRTNSRAGAIVADATATLRLVAWGEKALEIQQWETGDVVEVQNGLVKKGLQDELEIQLNNRSVQRPMEPGKETMADAMPSPFDALQKDYPPAKLNQQPSGNVRINGTIESVDERSGVFLVCPRCNAKPEKTSAGHSCPRCGAIEKPRAKAILALQFSDSTASVRCRLFGRVAEKLVQKNAEDFEDGLDEEARQGLVGKKIEVLAKARENAFSGENEISVKAWKETN
jgi:uncharacterized C2H2 Zn-finger protein